MNILKAHLQNTTEEASYLSAPEADVLLSESNVTLLVLILSIVIAAVCLWSISRFAYKNQNKLSGAKQVVLTRCITVWTLLAMIGGSWDIWWHRSVGRDTTFEPPHLMLYLFAGLALLGGLYGWYKTNLRQWRRISICLTIVILSSAFDAYWHALFGAEDLSNPIFVSWSPPHMLIVLTTMLGTVFLMSFLKADPNRELKNFFATAAFTIFAIGSMFLLWPFHPTDMFGQVASFYGAAPFVLAMVFILLSAQRWIANGVGATQTSILIGLVTMISYGKDIAPGITILPHDRPPNWVIIFAFLSAGIILDLIATYPSWLKGLLSGMVWGLFSFVVAPFFFTDQAFFYGPTAMITAVSASIIGGAIAGTLVSAFTKS